VTIQQDIRSLSPTALIELFVLDATSVGGTVTYFTSNTNPLRGNVVWQGQTYTPFPIDVEGFEIAGQGQLPRPKMRVSNTTGAFSALLLQFDDLLGAKVTRKRTLLKYLDAVNFPARRNLLTNTDALSTWSNLNNTTVVDGAALSVRGQLELSAITENTAGGVSHTARQQTASSVNPGDVLTMSACARPFVAGSKRYVSLCVVTGGAFLSNIGAVFDLQAASVTFTSSGVTAAIDKNGDGSLRLAATFPGADSAGQVNARVGLSTSSSTLAPNYTGDGVSGAYVGNVQLELSSAATSYQPIGATWSQNPTADPTAALPDDVYFIDRKSVENQILVEFELSAAFDVAGIMLPRGVVVQNVCPWKYRVADASSGCTYAGTAYFDANDSPVSSVGLDVCGKRLSSCQARFPTGDLPFGGMPAAGLIQ
jgi:lambda family phage minor tail protein L